MTYQLKKGSSEETRKQRRREIGVAKASGVEENEERMLGEGMKKPTVREERWRRKRKESG